MFPIPPAEVWAAAPKDVRWWAAAMPVGTYDHDDWADEDDDRGERLTMRTITITTRTLPPTDTESKRVRVRTSDGREAVFPWDHNHDAPEVHENAARMVVGASTITRVSSEAMGYTFLAGITEETG